MSGLELKDLAGLSKPLQKLIAACVEGLGAIARPWLIRRDARAIADARRILGESNLELTSAKLESINAEIAARVEYREAKRHVNLFEIVGHAASALPSHVGDEEPDPDWIGRFFAHAQDVSDANMRVLWGRLLAGEVAAPGSYSVRSLDFLRNLSTAEAKKFETLVQLALETGFIVNRLFPLISKESFHFEIGTPADDFDGFYRSHGLGMADFDLFRDIGLTTSEIEGVAITLSAESQASPVVLGMGDRKALFTLRNRTPDDCPWSVAVSLIQFTVIGRELRTLVDLGQRRDAIVAQLGRAAQRLGLDLSIKPLADG